jgi:hypothetical protein
MGWEKIGPFKMRGDAPGDGSAAPDGGLPRDGFDDRAMMRCSVFAKDGPRAVQQAIVATALQSASATGAARDRFHTIAADRRHFNGHGPGT